MDRRVDWDDVALAPGVRELAATIRSTFGVWVGVVSTAGEVFSLGATPTEPPRRLCAFFKSNPRLLDAANHELMTCGRTMRQWGESAGATPCAVKCHVGLSARLYPLHVEGQDDPAGHVYVSGFLREGSEVRDVITLKQAARQTDREALPEPWVEAIPRLSPADEAVLDRLVDALLRGVRARLAAQHIAHLDSPRHAIEQYAGMLGASPPMEHLFRLIERVSRGASTVLILGENGTGKELIARAVHSRSVRRDRPFVAVNCAAIPPDLIESELFGHVRGAFSGAHRDREGLFASADQGTFFLDEIGEMDVTLQAKLLRVLQEGTFLPVGDTVFRRVDVRIICATNRDLLQLVRQGKFREDLYYRINVITLISPPLRQRLSDLPTLAEHFLHRAARLHGFGPKRLSSEARDVLLGYEWPGNVRELENEMERAVLMSGDAEVITPDLLNPRLRGGSRRHPTAFAVSDLTMPEAVEALERQMITDAMRQTGWNKTRAARQLGISRRNLIRKVAAYELEGGGDDA